MASFLSEVRSSLSYICKSGHVWATVDFVLYDTIISGQKYRGENGLSDNVVEHNGYISAIAFSQKGLE
jgi:hypothetical protein